MFKTLILIISRILRHFPVFGRCLFYCNTDCNNYIKYYNKTRIYQKLGYKSPIEYRESIA
ncbi:IS3 family transposase [Carnobacterium divergens]|uniref:IS3 family transposase n=1 Tax=Carnobacterium divergens TaxID=2748 RepID=UPI001072B238